MQLRHRLRKIVQAARPTYRPPPASVSKELASLEALAAYQRWLRGVLCFLALLSFLFSLTSIEAYALEMTSDVAMLIVSLLGEVCIVKIYQVKAMHAGVTNPIYHSKPSVIHSPHFFSMLLEMFVWILHCPPGLVTLWADAENLDFLVVFRFYSVVLYLNNVTFAHRTFCRAMSAIADIPLNTSYYVRTAFIFDTAKTSTMILFCGWAALALMFSQAEGIGFWDSMYFCFVTAATIGYGDISPHTTSGRLIAFASWIFGLTVVAWVVGLTHEALSLSDAERNLFTLFQANELCNKVPVDAAKVIQRSFRLFRAKKQHRSIWTLNWLGYLLTSQVNELRRQRRNLRSYETEFLATLKKFGGDDSSEGGDALSAGGRTPVGGGARSPTTSQRPGGFRVPTPRSSPPGTSPLAATARPESAATTPLHGVSPTSGGARQRRATLNSQQVARLSKLDATLDQLILQAEAAVRARASNESGRCDAVAEPLC